MATEADAITFEEVDRQVQQRTYHAFLRASRVSPMTSRFHFDVSQIILRSAGVCASEARIVLEAILLLQQALDIHDDVDVSAVRSRQLRVLAGDYSSSQYYRVLSQLNNNRLLSAISDAVVAINEAKMTWASVSPTIAREQYMELQQVIHGQLLFALVSEYLAHTELSMAQVTSLVKAYIVNEEMRSRRVPRYFTFRQAYEWLSDAIDKALHLPADAIFEPLSAFLTESLIPLRNTLENQTLAEGNRP